MERYLVELTGDQLDRLNGMVREAINAAEDENKRDLEDLLLALHDIRGWREHIQAIRAAAASAVPVTNAARHENSRQSSSTRLIARALLVSVRCAVRRARL